MSGPSWNAHHIFWAKNDFLLFYSSVNSGLHNYGNKTTDQADTITLMIIVGRMWRVSPAQNIVHLNQTCVIKLDIRLYFSPPVHIKCIRSWSTKLIALCITLFIQKLIFLTYFWKCFLDFPCQSRGQGKQQSRSFALNNH